MLIVKSPFQRRKKGFGRAQTERDADGCVSPDGRQRSNSDFDAKYCAMRSNSAVAEARKLGCNHRRMSKIAFEIKKSHE
jgi:hypothetical protein